MNPPLDSCNCRNRLGLNFIHTIYNTFDFRLDFIKRVLHRTTSLLIEIEDVVVACACSKRRVGDILVFESEEQFSRTLHLELHTAGTEHFIGRTDVKLHIGDVEFRFVVMLYFAYLLLPVPMHELAFGITVVFLLRKHVRCCDIGITYLCADDIGARLGLVLYGRGDVGWVVEVQ